MKTTLQAKVTTASADQVFFGDFTTNDECLTETLNSLELFLRDPDGFLKNTPWVENAADVTNYFADEIADLVKL